MIKQTSSILYIASATPRPLKLKTSSSTGVLPSSGTEDENEQIRGRKKFLAHYMNRKVKSAYQKPF